LDVVRPASATRAGRENRRAELATTFAEELARSTRVDELRMIPDSQTDRASQPSPPTAVEPAELVSFVRGMDERHTRKMRRARRKG